MNYSFTLIGLYKNSVQEKTLEYSADKMENEDEEEVEEEESHREDNSNEMMEEEEIPQSEKSGNG